MDLDKVRLEFEAGTLTEAIIEPSPEGNGWMVLFKKEGGETVTLTDHSGIERVLHTLDAATRLAHEAGFETVRVEEPF